MLVRLVCLGNRVVKVGAIMQHNAMEVTTYQILP